MAVVEDQPTAVFSRMPFVKPSDGARSATAMPRSIVNFTLLNSVITAKPVNDQQELTVAVNLPREFAYRVLDLNCSLTQDVADDWHSHAYLEVTNGVRSLVAGSTQRHSVVIDQGLDRIPSATELWVGTFEPCRMPTYVVQAIDGVAPVVAFKATNRGAAVGGAGTFNFLLTFLEYDIEQAHLFPIHWPAIVYSR